MTSYKTLKGQDSLAFLSPLYQKHMQEMLAKKKRLIVITGPTGVGKTNMAISVAKILGGEVVSADSIQVYRHMDIGTAKPTPEQMKEVRHHLVDIRDINQPFNVVEFYQQAHQACRDILMREKVPIVVGGCGFYIHAFLYGPPSGPPSDPKVRQQLQKQMANMGPEVLYERLQMIDPEYAETISENDQQKIIRALEIIIISKRPVSSFPKAETQRETPYDARLWFLYLPKEILYQKVNERCEEMLQKGFVEEVEELQKQGLEKNPTAAQAIGYRQCLEYLHTQRTAEDYTSFVEEFKKASRHYIKRQMTWFKREPFFRWVNLDEIDREKALEFILQDYEQGA